MRESVYYEAAYVAALTLILILHVHSGRRGRLTGEPGWKLVTLGFALLLVGGIADFSDSYPSLSRFYVLGPTPAEAFLEKVVGYTLGAIVLAEGFRRWLPTIAARRLAEVELERRRQDAENQLDRFFSLSNDLLCAIDGAGRFAQLNPACERLLGYPPEELAGTPLVALVVPDDRSRAADAIATLAAGGKIADFHVRCLRKDGTTRWLAWSGHQPASESLVFAVAHDITALKETAASLTAARDQAEAANQAKSRFLANMSHELRTPLNSVIGFANVLLRGRPELAPAAREIYLGRIAANGKQLLRLINDVLDLAKIEAAGLEVVAEPVALRELLESLLRDFAAPAGEAGLELRSELPAELPPIRTDPGRLRQVLANLVSNAIKFTPHGTVTVRVAVGLESQDPLAIEVVDTGIGIAPEQLPRVFDAFHQVDSGYGRHHGGSGLGLAISRSLCELLGYRLDAESTVGRGSRFRVCLDPASHEPTTGRFSREIWSVGRAASEQRAPARLDGRRILIVDDQDDDREVVALALRELGARVSGARSGGDALLAATSERPDLMTVDLRMPGMDGWSLIAEVRRHPELLTLPIIVISGSPRGRQPLPERVDVLSKPVDTGVLAELVDRRTSRRANAG